MKEVTTYLTFNGNCREAMQFYAQCLGGDLHLINFGESPQLVPPEAKDRIMHARLSKGKTLLMASDVMPGMPFQQGNNFSVSLDCDDIPEAEKFYSSLSASGNIFMPLQETFWAQRFSMFTDRFGVKWMINVSKPMQ